MTNYHTSDGAQLTRDALQSHTQAHPAQASHAGDSSSHDSENTQSGADPTQANPTGVPNEDEESLLSVAGSTISSLGPDSNASATVEDLDQLHGSDQLQAPDPPHSEVELQTSRLPADRLLALAIAASYVSRPSGDGDARPRATEPPQHPPAAESHVQPNTSTGAVLPATTTDSAASSAPLRREQDTLRRTDDVGAGETPDQRDAGRYRARTNATAQLLPILSLNPQAFSTTQPTANRFLTARP